MKAMTKMLRRAQWLQTITLVALTPGLILLPSARSNPSGGTVVHGGVVIDDLTPGHLKIQQSTNKAIINWQDFSIAAGERTQFIQPGKDAIALNRVVSGNPSSIFGTLDANGGVILINQNGILVGGGGVVDVGGLLAMSTLDISDADFLDGGTMTFKGSSAAAITNLGTITSRGGDVVLLANMVDNAGTVGAPDGTVAFGAGGEFVVDTIGDSRISVVGAGAGGQTGINNSGTVNAAAVEFKAHGNVYALAIQNTGIVRANGASRKDGRIILSAAGDGTVGGRIESSGTIRARNRNGSGGEILIDGGVGGQVDITGGSVDANGDGNRNGGRITVLGDVVNVTGDAQVMANGANGGFVQLGSPETTKSISVGPNASVSANGSTGNGGTVQVLGNSASVVNIQGAVSANGAQSGGTILMQGGTVTTAAGSTVSANGGTAGGQVNFVGSGVNINGTVSATGGAGAGGGVLLNGSQVNAAAGSRIDVSGAAVGGMIQVDGASGVNVNGAVNANGTSGNGGGVLIQGNGGGVNVGSDAEIKANGATNGGSIQFDSAANTTVNGAISATGLNGLGGRINTTGDRVVIGSTAEIDASGRKGGGQVNIGGSYQGANTALRNSTSTVVEDGARVKVDAMEGGNGGNAVVWSNGSTFYRGDISAQAFGAVGNGGFVEVSGKEELSVEGTVSTLAASGKNGVFLIDPVNVSVGPGAGFTFTDQALVGFLGTNNVIIHTGGAGADVGDINIAPGANIIYDSPNSLTFLAHNNIFVNGDIKNHGTTDTVGGMAAKGTGNITLVSGWDGTLPALPNFGNPQALNDGAVARATDFILPDGTPIVGRFGSWGRLGTKIHLNNLGAEYVEIGSARGETNLFSDSILIQGGDSDGEATQVGYRRVDDVRAANAAAVALVPGMATSLLVDRTNGVVGNINVSGKSVVALIPDPGSSAVLGEGQKDRNNLYTMIGHGGMRSNDDNWDNKNQNAGNPLINNFGDDAGVVGVGDGDNKGNIVVFAGLGLGMSGDRVNAPTQIGHGGLFLSDPNVANTSVAVIGGFAGGAGESQGVFGNMTGNIDIKAGVLEMQGGVFSDSFAQIGHGGRQIIGEHGGNISVETTTGGITGIASPEVHTVTNGNNRDRTHVQIGHGGFRSYHFNARALSTGRVPGDGIQINPLTGLPYGHWGDITVTSAAGIRMVAGGNQGHAQIGHGGQQIWGDMRGDINVTALGGDIIFDRILPQADFGNVDRGARGIEAFVQIGHGGRLVQGGHTGDINVTGTGDFEMYAGRADSYAMVGHGGRGWEDDGAGHSLINLQTSAPGAIIRENRKIRTSGTHVGDITVDMGGDIKFRGGMGYGQFGFAQIGHGGWFNQADTNIITPQGGGNAATLQDTGHHGDISVIAGGTGGISFIAGATELREGQAYLEPHIQRSWVQIGHGGEQNRGDHWGEVTVEATNGDVVFEGRGGWDAVTIEGTDAGVAPVPGNEGSRGTPRIGIESGEDNGHTGWRNWAQIGHGGLNSNNSTENGNPIAKGIGTLSPTGKSDITVTAGGDIVIKAAQLDTIGPKPQTRANVISGLGTDVNRFVYDTPSGNLELGFGAAIFRPTVVTRFNGDVWTLPEPVAAARFSWGQIGHGGVFSSGNSLGNGTGHAGDITLTAGGGVIAKATDIDVPVATRQALSIDVDSASDGIGALDADGVTRDSIIRVGPGTPVEEFIATNGLSGDSRSQAAFSLLGYNHAMIGHGGHQSRGDHSGDITIVAGEDANGIGLLAQGGESFASFAQVGHGGYDADQSNNDNARLNDIGSRGEIDIQVSGDISILGGGRNGHVMGAPGTVTVNPGDGDQVIFLSDNSSFTYAQVGHGGYATGGTHSGNINVLSTDGGVTVEGGMNARFSYAQIGNGGANARGQAHTGNITVVADQDVVVKSGGPLRDSEVIQAEIDNPELNNTGHIAHGVVNYAQIGNGGWDADPQGGDLDLQAGTGGFSGSIEVVSVNGSVRLEAGGDPSISVNDDSLNRGNSAQIGHGGHFTDGDHRGDIRVAAGVDVEIMGGAGSRDGGAWIGHGGLNGGTAVTESGNFSGDIEVVAGRDLIMNRGTNTDTGTGGQGLWAIRQHNAGTTTFGLYRYSNTVENTAQFNIFPTIPTGVAQPAIPAGTQVTAAFPSGFQVGDKVRFTALTGGTGLLANTIYFVRSVSGNSFELSATSGGAAIPFTTAITAASMQKVLDITAVASTDRITAIGNTFQTGDRIRILTDQGGLVTTTSYFVRDLAADGSFRVSTTQGGTPVDITGDIAANTIARSNTEVVQVFRTTRDGNEVFNNYAKIGHGDHLYRQRGSGNPSSFRNGDIDVSVGRDVVLSDPANRPYADAGYVGLNRDMVLIGHIDPINSGSSAFRSTTGHTYIGASRTNPFDTGTGRLMISPDAVLTSAGGGFFGELRLYVPTPAQNLIQTGASFNGSDYTRIPEPDGTRADELEGTDHEQTVGLYGEPDGQFVPDGPYSPSGFGQYNIYYGAAEPVIPPGPGPGPGGGGGFLPPVIEEPVPTPVIPLFDFFPFIFTDKYDSFDRDEDMVANRFLYGLFSIFGLDANALYEDSQDDGIRVEGDEILEEPAGLFGLGPAQTEEENEEEEDKSGRFLRRPHTMYGVFWTYDITTGEYSSYRAFGLPSVSTSR